MRHWAILLPLLFSVRVGADEPIDRVLFYTITTLHLIDLGQSLDIKNHADRVETNPLLGRHPSDETLYIYKLGAIGVDYLALKLLSKEWRRLFLAFDIGSIAQVTTTNASIGLRVAF